MPLASVDEWRARIGSSWCALGRPVKSRRPRYREYRYGSPPPGGGKRVKLQDDGSVSAILMFILMVVAMLTLWSLILNGYSPICTSIMLCTSLDVVLMQCALCMSLLSSSVSQPVSNIILSVHHELKLGSGTKLEDFPYCTKFPIKSDLDLFACGYFFCFGEEQIEAKVPVASTVKRNLFRSMSNFWHQLVERVKSIKKCLSLAMVKFSLLLRCGDVEENPGPYDQEKDGARGIRLTADYYTVIYQKLMKHAVKWREIGVHLGFFGRELDNIQAKPLLLSAAPDSWLREMLSIWLEWSPGDGRGSANFATLEDLKRALSDAGLGATAHDLHIPGLDDTPSPPEHREHLGINDIREVLDVLWEYRAKWRFVGMELGISVGDLDAIAVDNRKNADCLLEVLKLWLVQVNPKPTRSALTRALQSKSVAGKLTTTQGHETDHQDPNEHIDKENSQGHREHLGINDIKEVLDVLWDYRAKWRFVGMELGIPIMDLNAITANEGNASDRLLEVIKLWLGRVNPKPTRSALTRALQSKSVAGRLTTTQGHETDHQDPNEHIDKENSQDEISEKLFLEAMSKEGFVKIRSVVLLLIGVAGAGKTCFSHMLFNEDPPSVRESTPLAQASVRAVSFSRATAQSDGTELVWERVSRHKFNCLIADVIKCIRSKKKSRPSATSQPRMESSGRIDTTQSEQQNEQAIDDTSTSIQDERGEDQTPAVEQLLGMKSVQELIDLISKSEGSEEITEQTWLYIVDSGGQPQFHDLLPSFVRHVSAAVFFVKLNEKLDDCPEIKYYSKGGELCGQPYRSTQNHLQILQNCLQAMQFRNRDDDNDSALCPDLFFVGTHRDEENSTESLEAKNKELKKLVIGHPLFRNHFCSQSENHLLYQVNSKKPDGDDLNVVGNFRQAIMNTHMHEDRVPIRWFVLEQLLQHLSVDGVVSFKECLKVAGHLKMEEKHLKAALRYLAKLNIFEYFPHVLPKIVFTTTQVLLNKLTEFVEYSHYLQNSSKLNVHSVDLHFRDYGEITIGMLKREKFSRHYIDGLFEAGDLLRLWEDLLVIARRDSNTYVMPAVLSALPKDKLSQHRLPADIKSVKIVPIAVFYPDGFFPSGIFSSLISRLQSNHGWMILKEDERPECLHRNCVTFSITGGVEANVTLIYFHDWIELHVIDLFDDDEQESCTMIRNALFIGLNHAQEIQKHDKLQPQLAFFCTCRGENDQHLATVTSKKKHMQCRQRTRTRVMLTEKHQVWLHDINDKLFNSGASLQDTSEHMENILQKRSTLSGRQEDGSGCASPPPLNKLKQDSDFSNVDRTTILGESQLGDVIKEVCTVKVRYFQLGVALGIPAHQLETLQKQYGAVNYDQALNDMILLWLRGRTSRTWQALVRAVDSETGGNNHPLALEIASRHLRANLRHES